MYKNRHEKYLDPTLLWTQNQYEYACGVRLNTGRNKSYSKCFAPLHPFIVWEFHSTYQRLK